MAGVEYQYVLEILNVNICFSQVHSTCLESYQSVSKNNICTFRDLVYMIVPPNCVSMSVSQNTLDIEETVDG